MKNRNLKLVFAPTVRTSTAGQSMTIITGCRSGSVRWNVTGELAVWCAVQLIRDLRKGLRRIKDEETKRLADAITQAEGEL